jgi:hypothetical protein
MIKALLLAGGLTLAALEGSTPGSLGTRPKSSFACSKSTSCLVAQHRASFDATGPWEGSHAHCLPGVPTSCPHPLCGGLSSASLEQIDARVAAAFDGDRGAAIDLVRDPTLHGQFRSSRQAVQVLLPCGTVYAHIPLVAEDVAALIRNGVVVE